jgi:hypothetical protein
MNLTKNGITIDVSDAAVIEMVLQRLNGEKYPTTLYCNALPRIGEPWRGGLFAGIARGQGGARDYPLIVLAEEAERASWRAQMDWAKTLDADLPTPREQALLFANVPELFKGEAYWSNTEYAGYEGYAWCQTFDDGTQGYYRKDTKLLARAVRRIDPLTL